MGLMYKVNTPADFADWLRGEHEPSGNYWPDDIPRPSQVEEHPQGQVYVRLQEDEPAQMVGFVLDRAYSCGLHVRVGKDTLTIREPPAECAWEGCYADAKESKPYRDLCEGHSREAQAERLKGPAGTRKPEFWADGE